MNTSSLKSTASVLLAAAAFSQPILGQVFYDLKTTSGSTTAFVAQIHQSGFDQPGQPTTPDVLLPAASKLSVWIIADTGNNGLPFLPSGNPSNSYEVRPNQFLGADDLVVATDLTPGNAFGAANASGRYGRNGVQVNPEAANANIYFIVFGVGGLSYELTGNRLSTTGNTTTPITVSAPSFGVFGFGNPTEPPVGNAFLHISSKVFVDQFSVVPEPEEYAAFAGVGLLVFAGWYRRNKRTN
jgi:hypothetical protein